MWFWRVCNGGTPVTDSSFHLPPSGIGNEEHLRKVVRALTIFGTPRIISMLKTPKEFKKSISEGNYPFKLFQFARGRYTDGNMEELLAKYDEVGTNYVPEIYVIFFIGGIPPKYADSCAGVVF